MSSFAVYRMYDADDRLLYVGCSSSWPLRLDAHRTKDWFTDVSRVALAHYSDKRSALSAERLAQRDEDPIHNIVCHGSPAPPRARPRPQTRTTTPLRMALTEGGYIHGAIATRVGLHPGTFSRIVNGWHCDQATRQKISAALGREISELWPDHMEQAA